MINNLFKILWKYFSGQSELIASNDIDTSLNDSMVHISEETILTALQSSQLRTYDIDYTLPITIEIGAMDRPHQDSSILLGIVLLIL